MIHQVRVDQTAAPVGASGSGVTWQTLGTFTLDDTSVIRVVGDDLSDGTPGDGLNDFIVADGVRISFDSIIPEPTTAALLGLAGLALLRRRRTA